MKKHITELLFVSLLLILGCATPKKAKLESTDLQIVIETIYGLKTGLIESNADVLAKDQFESGNDDFNDALEELNENKPREQILSLLAQAKSHYMEAKIIASSREVVPQSIMSARQNALNSRLFRSQILSVQLNDVDNSLRDETDDFSKSLSSNKLSLYQTKYLALEVEAVQNYQLGVFRNIIKKAEDNDAEDLAPKTYKEARSQVKVSENLIKQSPRNSFQYEESVEAANKAAKLLDDVINQLNGEAKGSSENVALKLVYQERRLGRLSDKVVNLQGSIASKDSKIGIMSLDLENKNNEILNSKDKILFQKAMNQVRTSFSEDEASVYQQGKKLIIRIKEISFRTGSAAIPSSSMKLLSKINSIVVGINPKEIMIEGHTDSTGPQDANLMLSNKRAKAVKKYLNSLDATYLISSRGFGESKPIANNQTKEGRSLNRRVDIVVRGNQ